MRVSECAPARVALFKRTGSCLTKKERSDDPTTLRVALRPKKPPSWRSNPRQWLSTTEINEVLAQYTQSFKRFAYLGAHPRDFGSPCLPDAPQLLCDFDLRAFLASGRQELGLVFNLDTRHQRGSHWVALYASYNAKHKTYGACYFDSTGAPPPVNDIGRFLSILSDQARALGFSGWRPVVNARTVQRKNTECGVFAMKFIISCLQNRRQTYDTIIGALGGDDEVWKYRRVLFRG